MSNTNIEIGNTVILNKPRENRKGEVVEIKDGRARVRWTHRSSDNSDLNPRDVKRTWVRFQDLRKEVA